MVNSRLNRFGSSVVGSGAVRGQCVVFYLYLHSILKGLRRIVREDKEFLSKNEIWTQQFQIMKLIRTQQDKIFK